MALIFEGVIHPSLSSSPSSSPISSLSPSSSPSSHSKVSSSLLLFCWLISKDVTDSATPVTDGAFEVADILKDETASVTEVIFEVVDILVWSSESAESEI